MSRIQNDLYCTCTTSEKFDTHAHIEITKRADVFKMHRARFDPLLPNQIFLIQRIFSYRYEILYRPFDSINVCALHFGSDVLPYLLEELGLVVQFLNRKLLSGGMADWGVPRRISLQQKVWYGKYSSKGMGKVRSEAFLRKGNNLLPELITYRFVLNNDYLFIAFKVETLELELD